MTEFVLEAELREKTGKAESRRMRRAGKIPGIIYGGGKPDLPIMMDYFTISKLLNDERFFTSMIDVNVKGSRGKNTGLLKATQWDPLLDTIKHLDFFRVSGSDEVTVEVHIVAVNHEISPGEKAGGMLEIIRHTLEVTCRADSIPEHIEIDCSQLEIGDGVHIEDVKFPAGVEIHHDTNFTILNMAPPVKAEPVAEEVEVAATEAADEAKEASEE